LTAANLIMRLWQRPQERVRCLGYLLFLGGIACLAVGLGWGRAHWGKSAGFIPRYVTLAAPALFTVYFAWQDGGRFGGRLVQMVTFTLLCGVLAINMQKGLEGGRELRAKLAPFERDVAAGTPPAVLASMYSTPAHRLYPFPDRFADFLRMLRAAGIGNFRSLPDEGVAVQSGAKAVTASKHVGVHEAADGVIAGWAWDPKRPNSPIKVEILADDESIATVTADLLRADLLREGIGDGKHGFQYPLPANLKDGRPHLIRVRIAGANTDLKRTPRSVTVPPQ
jgi:hypothetical protein